MALQLKSPLPAMEAQSVEEIPVGPEWQYEPKWDGFRCLAFRDHDRIELQSKAGQSLTRYFPEVVDALRSMEANQFVLDSELVVPIQGALSFDDLLQRLHPAASRVNKLAREHPALMLVFDLLAGIDGKSLLDLPLLQRRKRLEQFARAFFKNPDRVRLSPSIRDPAEAKKWFESRGSNLDGIIAKRLDLPYVSEDRSGMRKIKRRRTADCVVGGFRYGEKNKLVGSLLLGLYDGAGLLNHVGFCSAIKADERPVLTTKLERIIKPPGFTGRAPGGPSRWSTERSTEWQPLEPKLVVEVSFDHVSGERFRHGTRLVRWRPDKNPRQCGMDQLDQKRGSASFDLF
jgi:ATP-dependent DNA ligase